MLFLLALTLGCTPEFPATLIADGGDWDLVSFSYTRTIDDVVVSEHQRNDAGGFHFMQVTDMEDASEDTEGIGSAELPDIAIIDGQEVLLQSVEVFQWRTHGDGSIELWWSSDVREDWDPEVLEPDRVLVEATIEDRSWPAPADSPGLYPQVSRRYELVH